MFIERYMYNHIVLCGNVKINIACVSTTCTRLHAELLTQPPHPPTHTPSSPSTFCLTYPLATVHTLIKVIYLIPLRPLQPPLCATLFHLPPVSFPTLLLSSRFLSGRSLPGVIHLSLPTWPLTGLLGRLVKIAVVKDCWESNKLWFSVMVTHNSEGLRDLVWNREPNPIQTGVA